ncbi:MAG: hypothetical protein R2912_02790 [Eubacteriales bacterium]
MKSGTGLRDIIQHAFDMRLIAPLRCMRTSISSSVCCNGMSRYGDLAARAEAVDEPGVTVSG